MRLVKTPALLAMLVALLTFSARHSLWASASSSLRTLTSNPLLRGAELPRYASINHEHVATAVQQLLSLTAASIATIEQDPHADFQTLFAVLEEIDTYANKIWFPIHHLRKVNDSEALRAAYDATLPQITAIELQLAQHPVIYRKLLQLAEDTDLTPEQQQAVALRLDTARAAGAALHGTAQQRFKRHQHGIVTVGHQVY